MVVRTPVRTCVGCRRRDEQTVLLRLVARRPPAGPHGDWTVVPDERRDRPGRGAYVHPAPECVQRALQRKALGRTLRQAGLVDTTALEAWLAQRT